MNTANNQLHQETERRLRQELLCFLEREQEPTVSELCEAAQINRSTFYRHYRDIPDLMEKTEKEIQKGLFRTVGSQGDFLTRLESSSDALEPLISYIGQNRYFYRAYLRKNGDAALEDGYQLFWEKNISPMPSRVLLRSSVCGWRAAAARAPGSWPGSSTKCCRQDKNDGLSGEGRPSF